MVHYLVIGTLVVVFYLIYRNWVRPSIGMLGAIMLFILCGILTPEDMLKGFSNQSIASVVLLILITAGLSKNFNLEPLFDRLFRRVRSYRVFLLRMMTQVALLSSIVNNTPVVALMTPYVFNWGKKSDISPSRLLIPLSFATIMGGMITVIGTSTTLVLNGFLMENGQPGLQATELLVTGLSVTVTGILFMALVGYRLLPNRRDLIETFKKNAREYIVETMLTDDSPFIGQTVVSAGLRNLRGAFLVEIIRNGQVISPVDPSEIIGQGDLLFFAGNTQEILDLVKASKGIKLPKQASKINTAQIQVIEVVVNPNSTLIGKQVRNTDFRSRYDAAIVAIHRNGERLSGRIGDATIKTGDLLLLFAGKDFSERVDFFRDIYVISEIRELPNVDAKKRYSLIAVGAIAIGLLALGYYPLFTSLLIIFTLLVALKMITLRDVKREMDLNLIAILVFSLVLGEAIIKTGTGELVASGVVNLLHPYGNLALLTGLLVLTTLLSSFITNVGAVSIAFPVAYAVSQQLGIDGAPLYLGIAYAASAAFLTPIGYQTNLIIYGPGGYTFKDFIKVGLPVTVVYLATALVSILLHYPEVFL